MIIIHNNTIHILYMYYIYLCIYVFRYLHNHKTVLKEYKKTYLEKKIIYQIKFRNIDIYILNISNINILLNKYKFKARYKTYFW